ncbi:MAG: T9SS type A sorting domain-containing protein [Kaistella sp.]|nr:T9SS type A sorting domain-containing protein [Kaistella sp.]
MKTFFTTLFFLVISFQFYCQNISLDPGYAINGVLRLPAPSTSEINSFDFDQNGNVYTAGSTLQGSGSGIFRLTVSKSGPTGVLDSQFGTNGISTISFENSEYPLDIKVLPNSKILVSGSAYTGHTPSGPGIHIGFLVRLNTDGTLDHTFSNNGVFRFTGSASHFTSIHLMDDSSIMLSGNINHEAALLKLNPTGNVDLLFGINGIKNLSSSGFNFLLWKSVPSDEGNLISVGYDYTDLGNTKIAYCETDMQGNFVPSFGTGGKVVLDLYNGIPNITELLTTIKKAPDGQYYLGGYHISNVLIRINADGSFDPAFASAGVLTHATPFKDFDIQNDGKILLAGTKVISDYNYGYTVTRLNSNGNVDITFNSGTAFALDLSPENDYIQCLKSLGPDTFMIGGSSYESGAAKSTLIKLILNSALTTDEVSAQPVIQIYPNPFKDRITVNGAGKLNKAVIYNAAGRLIPSRLQDNTILIGADLPKGVYFLNAETQKGKTITSKLIKE